MNAKKDSRRAISQRKDGTYQKAITIDGKRKYFYGRSEKDVIKKIAEFSREAVEEAQNEGGQPEKAGRPG